MDLERVGRGLLQLLLLGRMVLVVLWLMWRGQLRNEVWLKKVLGLDQRWMLRWLWMLLLLQLLLLLLLLLGQMRLYRLRRVVQWWTAGVLNQGRRRKWLVRIHADGRLVVVVVVVVAVVATTWGERRRREKGRLAAVSGEGGAAATQANNRSNWAGGGGGGGGGLVGRTRQD